MSPAPATGSERTGSHLICAAPRTGSGLLDCTRVAGHPESWFRRQDEREFAASLPRAEQTGVWFEMDDQRQEPTGEPGFDFSQVSELIRQTEEHNAAWEHWFAEARERKR